MNEAVSLGSKPKEQKKTFSFTKELDGVKKTVRGEEVENGWIITIDKEWKELNPITDQEEYKYNSWKYISKDNPLDKLKDKDNPDAQTGDESDISHMLGEITTSQGMLLVD